MKESFILFHSFYPPIKSLNLEQKGLLLDAIFLNQIEGITPELPPVVGMAFQFIRMQLARNDEKYEKMSIRNRTNGAKGGRPKEPKKPSGLSGLSDKNCFSDNNEKSENDTPQSHINKGEKPSGLFGNPNDNDNDLKKKNKKKTAPAVAEIYLFENFWNDYGKKYDQKKCSAKWLKISEKDKLLIKEFLPEYKKATPDKQFRKNPFTFLHNECWNDELLTTHGEVQKNSQPEIIINQTW